MKKSLAAKVLPKSVQDDIDRQIEPHLKVRASGVGLCSTKTGKERRMHIRASVAQLWVLGYRILKLASLSPKHIQALMTYWEKEGRSAEFLHNRLSALRTLAGWLGKRNVVLDMEDYFPRERTQRHAATRVNLSWSANGVDPLKMIEFARKIDERLAVMLSLQHFFGLRVKESMEIRPGNALIDGGRAIEVFEGTKGGKPRQVPIRNEAQREAFEWACRVATEGRIKRLRWPDCTWLQAQGRFYGFMRRLMITKDQLGVTPHGLRHGNLQRLYREESGFLSPIEVAASNVYGTAVAMPIPPLGLTREIHLQACRTVSREAGHVRTGIGASYFASYGHGLRKGPRLDNDSVPPPTSMEVTFK